MIRHPIQPRWNWKDEADRVGFTFHHMDGQQYWDESAWYGFTLQQAEEIEAAAEGIHALCLDFVAEAVKSERIMERLAIPAEQRDYVAETWTRGDPSLYGRFDFAYDGKGPPKLYEYNADTPTSIFETAVFQWLWLEGRIKDGTLPANADQFNSLFEKLRDRFTAIFPNGGYVHFSSDPDHVEDRQTVKFLEDLALQAGLEPKFVSIHDIGLDGDGRFVDEQNDIIQAIFKLYPWEFMFREDYAPNIAASKTQFLEPAWKSLLSTRACFRCCGSGMRGIPTCWKPGSRTMPGRRVWATTMCASRCSRAKAPTSSWSRTAGPSRCWTRAMAPRAGSARRSANRPTSTATTRSSAPGSSAMKPPAWASARTRGR